MATRCIGSHGRHRGMPPDVLIHLYLIYFFFVLVEPLGSSAVNGRKSRPCM